MGVDELSAHVEQALATPALRGVLVAELAGERVGTLEFACVNRRSRVAAIGGLAVDPARRREGLGVAILAAVWRFLNGELGYHRVQAEVYGFNAAAQRLLERAGFTREGVRRRAYWRRGAWQDGVLFGLLEEDSATMQPMPTRYLHTMLRSSDIDRTRRFLEALGYEFTRELPIIRDGQLEATNYFFALPGDDAELEITVNHDGRSYELGTAYGHVAIGVDDLDATLAALAAQGIEPERPPYRVREGGSRLCFVREPAEGYRFELIEKS
jgi:lactoylglutathione lyase